MLLLIFILAIAIAGSVHAILQAWAPSNILIRRVKSAPPRWSTVGGLVGLAYALILMIRGLELAIAAGAPTMLYVLVGICAWDCMKVALLALREALRTTVVMLRRREKGHLRLVGQL